MVFPNEKDDCHTEEQDNTFSYPFIKWNCHKIITYHFMIAYWLKSIFKPHCCKNKTNSAFMWSPWMEKMEEIYRNENLNIVFKTVEDWIDNN